MVHGVKIVAFVGLSVVLSCGAMAQEKPMVDEMPPGAPASAPATRAVPADLTTPRGAMKVFAMSVRAGDEKAIRGVLAADNANEAKLVDALVNMAKSTARLRTAAVAKYGAEVARQMTSDSPTFEDETSVDSAVEQIDGDEATVEVTEKSGDSAILQLSRIDGTWHIRISQIIPVKDPTAIATIMPKMAAFERVIADVANRIESGEYASAEAAKSDLLDKTAAAANAGDGPTTQP